MIQYALSLISSVVLGFALGLEREITNKQAGLRTHIFVCLGSCVFTLLSIHGFPTFALDDNVGTRHYLYRCAWFYCQYVTDIQVVLFYYVGLIAFPCGCRCYVGAYGLCR